MFKILSLVAALLIGTQAQAAQCSFTIEKVHYKNLVANLYIPKTEAKPAVIIAFGGSEGGLSTGNATGELLAPHCIAVLGLAYFKEEGLPATLDHIPLEYFIEAIDFVSARSDFAAGKIGLISGSRGSEAALLVASLDARIRSVLVSTPSNIAWFGRTTEQAAWTYHGTGVNAIAPKDIPSIPQVQRFEAALSALTDLDEKRIPVERINGPIFFISAGADEIWPSTQMSNDMTNHLRNRHFKFQVRHDMYPTGHSFDRDHAPQIRQSVVDWMQATLAADK